jgi:MFS family permease
MTTTFVTESVRKRLMATLFSAQSVFSAAQGVSFALLPLAAVYLTGNEALAGLPTTIVLTGRAAIAFPIGWLMDKLGRRLGISLGLLLAVAGAVLSTLGLIWGSFTWFCAGALLTGMGRGTAEQSRYAAADIETPARAAKAIGTIVFAGTVGAVLGPILIAPAEHAAEARNMIGLSGPFALTALLSMASVALIFFFLRPDPQEISQRRAASSTDINTPIRSQSTIFHDPTVLMAVATLTIAQLVMTLIMVITPLHMAHHQHDTTAISLVVMAHTLGMFGLSSVTGWLVGRIGKLPVIMIGALILAISAVLAPLSNNAWMLAFALFLLGLGWNLDFVAGSALLSGALATGERGKTQGVSETFVAVAAATGAFATGIAFQWGGLLAVCMIGLALTLALIAALFWSRTRQPAPQAVGYQ